MLSLKWTHIVIYLVSGHIYIPKLGHLRILGCFLLFLCLLSHFHVILKVPRKSVEAKSFYPLFSDFANFWGGKILDTIFEHVRLQKKIVMVIDCQRLWKYIRPKKYILLLGVSHSSITPWENVHWTLSSWLPLPPIDNVQNKFDFFDFSITASF